MQTSVVNAAGVDFNFILFICDIGWWGWVATLLRAHWESTPD